MTFVSANRELNRVGRRRCFVISLLKPGQHASVHSSRQRERGAGAVDRPSTSRPYHRQACQTPPAGTTAGALPVVIEALPPGAVLAAIPPIAKAKARVKIVARLRPRVTG